MTQVEKITFKHEGEQNGQAFGPVTLCSKSSAEISYGWLTQDKQRDSLFNLACLASPYSARFLRHAHRYENRNCSLARIPPPQNQPTRDCYQPCFYIW